MSYSKDDININSILQSGTNVTLTGYKINGAEVKFLMPFYKGTFLNGETNLRVNPTLFKINGSYPEICPKYILHSSSSNGNSIPSGVTKMFVVCIGGGGGGGGGGVRVDGKINGGSGGGGGGGAMNAWFVNFVNGQTTYNVTIGAGGSYGQPTNQTGIAQGGVAAGGAYSDGQDGGDGGSTTFTYNSTSYTSNGGSGGDRGYGHGGSSTYKGGPGGAVTTSPEPSYTMAGSAGGDGVATHTVENQDGGIGGANGNKRGTDERTLINNLYINVQPFTPFTSTDDGVGSTYNNDRICYGDGGRGGRGEAESNWAWAGYSGHPGCCIVFFYY